MSGSLLQILGILVVIALIVTLLVRPAGIVPIVLAVGVVAVAIFVTWNQVETYRAQKAASAGVFQPEAQAGVTVPPPNLPRAGS
jgi:hypothetical protein